MRDPRDPCIDSTGASAPGGSARSAIPLPGTIRPRRSPSISLGKSGYQRRICVPADIFRAVFPHLCGPSPRRLTPRNSKTVLPSMSPTRDVKLAQTRHPSCGITAPLRRAHPEPCTTLGSSTTPDRRSAPVWCGCGIMPASQLTGAGFTLRRRGGQTFDRCPTGPKPLAGAPFTGFGARFQCLRIRAVRL